MKLLIITQKVDKNDPVLGFFHTWIAKLSSMFDAINVICLEKGEYDLPGNVKVFSLGKAASSATCLPKRQARRGGGKLIERLKYIFKFFHLCFFSSLQYDSVFVHMNQEYVLLGGIFWNIFGKKVYFWRNHPKGNFLTRIAVALSEKVFCTSDSAFTARFFKTFLVPVGIDSDLFRVGSSQYLASRNRKILFLGRMDRIKRPDLLIESLNILNNQGVDFISNFYGDPTPGTHDFYDSLKSKVSSLGLSEKVKFYNGVPNYKTPDIYNEHKIFVNLTPSGSMDKTILESVSCGCIPIVVNSFFREIFDSDMIVKEDTKDISDKIKFWLEKDDEYVEEASRRLQKYVLENHSLDALMNKINADIDK